MTTRFDSGHHNDETSLCVRCQAISWVELESGSGFDVGTLRDIKLRNSSDPRCQLCELLLKRLDNEGIPDLDKDAGEVLVRICLKSPSELTERPHSIRRVFLEMTLWLQAVGRSGSWSRSKSLISRYSRIRSMLSY